MLRKLFFLLMSLLMTIVVMAEGVDRNTALKKAQAFMPGKQFVTAKAIPSARAKAPRKNDVFYVFNATENDGYVIVSGDDRTTEILGYSKQGNLDMDNLPENLKWWLDSYARQIEALDSSWMKPAQHISKAPSTVAIEPLITAHWGQEAPYNHMCPDGNYVDYYEDGYNVNYRCLTGCTATAMAQVMYYWKWPESCPALTSYEINNYTIKGLPATTFKWNLMKDAYADETGPSAEAVAELMRYCGQAVKMDYSLRGSAASITDNLLISVFQYSSSCHSLPRDRFSTAQWESIIYDELSDQRPVLYSGHPEKGDGHAFIIDGYNNGFFHINWGWEGYCDSYFTLSLADPHIEPGEGGSDGAYQYNQIAVIGVKPAEEGETEITLKPDVYFYYSEQAMTATYHRNASSANFNNVYLSGYYSISCNQSLESPTNIEIGWGLYQNDVLKKVLYSNTISFTESIPYGSNNTRISLGADLSDGTYQLFQIYRYEGESEWKRDIIRTKVIAEVTSTTLRINENVNMAFTVNSITVSDDPEINNRLSIKANITNTGMTYQLRMGLWMMKEGTSEGYNINVSTFYIDPGESSDIFFSFVPKEAGSYDLVIGKGYSSDGLGKTTIKIAGQETITKDGVTYLCTPDYRRAKVVSNDNADKSIEHLTILSKVKAGDVDCNVTQIDDNVFYNWNNLQSVTIQEGVEYIGAKAFERCYLISLVLPSTISYIGKSAFVDNDFNTIFSNIQNPPLIDEHTFAISHWNEYTQVYDYTPSSATLYVPNGTKAKYEAIPGWTCFAKIEEGTGDLKEKKIETLKYSYRLGGSTATVIQDESYRSLSSVTIPKEVTIDGQIYSVTSIGNNAFNFCIRLQSLSLSEGIEFIGDNAFNYVSLSKIKLPSTLKTIGENAFSQCPSLKEIIVPEGVKSIGSGAFAYMNALTKLELPNSLENIGTSLINGCSKLTSVISHITDPSAISKKTFANSTWNNDTKQYDYTPCAATLYVPIGTKAKYEALSGWTWFADIVESEEASTGIKSIDNGQLTIDNGAVYDLQGRKMKNPLLTSPSGGTGNGLKPGLYIVNGKKVVVK